MGRGQEAKSWKNGACTPFGKRDHDLGAFQCSAKARSIFRQALLVDGRAHPCLL